MKKHIILLAAAGLIAAGCQVSFAEVKKGVTKQQIDTALKGCVETFATFDLSFKDQMRTFMGVSRERTPMVFCQRLMKGVLDGRINYSDINRLQSDRSTQLFLVLKGK